MFCEASLAVVGAGDDLIWTGPEEGPLPKFRTLRICPRASAAGMGNQNSGVEEYPVYRSSV